MRRFIAVIGIAGGILAILGGILLSGPPSVSAETAPAPALAVASTNSFLFQTSVVTTTHRALNDLACRTCHQDTDGVVTLPSGESFEARVDLTVLQQSAHGDSAESPLQCNSCHQPLDQYQYPHTEVGAATLRDYAQQSSAACERCHVDAHPTSHPDGPDSAEAVFCTDCHGDHDVQTAAAWESPRTATVCVDCHQERDVAQQSQATLYAIIQNGLFAHETSGDAYCQACHSQPGQTLTLASGETLSLTVDQQTLHNSVHGRENEYGPLACKDCHAIDSYPHRPIAAAGLRDYTLIRNRVCADCHQDQADRSMDSVHGRELAAGNTEAAVCTDCHGAHDTPRPDVPRQRISHTCEQCHSGIYDEYVESVHGEALMDAGNPDVPTCISCHGVHDIGDPTTNLFRVRSPELCATCHADDELMTKYDISTEVFETYVADFHGTTVTLFEHQDPNAETNKAVCYDCHGVHNIKATDDPDVGIKATLLTTCQECHPDATTNFPDSWTSHFEPSLEHNPLVYLVNLFYQIVIPVTIGFFALVVGSDVYRRVRLNLRK